MTDRALLELAAKAIGQDLYWLDDCSPAIAGRLWNPLDDDGDALRLAVKLGMRVSTRNGGARPIAEVMIGYGLLAANSGKAELHGDDAMAATRRAIVRAAAEIGRAMP